MKSSKKALAFALAAAMVVTAFPVTNAEAASTAKLSATKATIYVGGSKTLSVKTPSNWKNVKVTATSSKKSVAKISKVSGKKVTVKAVKKGTAKVTVKVTAKKAGKKVSKTLKATVTVKNAAIKLSGATTVATGATTTLTAKTAPASAKVTFSSDNTEVATVDANGVVTGVKAGTATITASAKVNGKTVKATTTITVADDFAITDLTATSASTLVATLATPLTETAKVEVTKAGITTPVSGEVKADGTTLTFSATANLTAGTYTMTITDGDKNASKSVEVQNEYVKEIVITSTQALTDPSDKKKAFIYYDVKNQYGESLRQSTSIEWSSSAKKITADKAAGKLTVESDQNFVYGNQIYVTGVYTKTGVAVNKAVTVGMEQALNSVETVGFVDVNKPTKKLDSLPKDFAKNTYYMIYATKDQDGNLLDAANDNISTSKVTFISDNILLVKIDDKDEKTFTIDGVEYSAVAVEPGQYVDKGGEVNITAISNKTGTKSVKNYVVGAGVLLSSLAITGPSETVADGDKNVKLAYTAKDTAGNTVTNYESIVRSTNTLSLTVSEGTLTVKEENDGTAGLYWSDDSKYDGWSESATADEVDRTVALTTVVVGGTSDNYLLSVSDKRKPVAIKEIKSVNGGANAIVTNDTQTIRFNNNDDVVYLDQYGKDMKATDAAAFFNYSYTNGFGKGTSYAYGVKADFADNNDFVSQSDVLLKNTSYTLSLTAKDANTILSDTVKFSIAQIKLADKNSAVSAWDVAGKVKTLSFDIVPVDRLSGIAFASVGKKKLNTGKDTFNNGSEDDSFDIKAAVADNTPFDKGGFDVKVVGQYNAKTLQIPANYYAINQSNVKATANKITAVSAGALNYSDLYDANSARFTRKDASLTISADVYNDTAKSADKKNATVKLTVKVSDEARKATTLVIKEGTDATKNATLTGKTIKDWFTENNKSASNGVYVLDQYGDLLNVGFTYAVSDIKEAATEFTHLADSIKVNANDTATAAVTKAELGDTFKLTITGTDSKKNSVSAAINITLGADTKANIHSGQSANATDDYTLRTTVLGYDR